MKKIFLAIALIFIAGVPLLTFAQVPIQVSPSLPGSQTTGCTTSAGCNPLAYIENFYEFALILGGVLAFGAVVYGGVLYITSAGNPSSQHEGKEWIQSALLGLLLLAGAYLILKTVNPQLVQLQLPSLTPVNIAPAGTGTGTPTGGNNPSTNANSALSAANINVTASSIAGIQSSTVDALVDLRNDCGNDPITVTSVTAGAHASGQSGCTHANGYKADVQPNPALNSCIAGFQPDGTRSDGAPLYLAPDGAIYADERTQPPNCGTPCNWTAPHWDMQSCGVN